MAALRFGQEFSIRGVAAFSTPFDLEALAEPGRALGIVPDQIGKLLAIRGWTDGNTARMRAASPVTLLAATSPPFLVVRGADDQLVPAAQAARFCERAAALAVACSVLVIPAAKHALWSETELARFATQWNEILLDWLRRLYFG